MHMEHDENMGGHFPLALWKGYIRMHCAQIFWGKKWKENKILQNHWKHCLKQIAWHKQHPHPKLPLMQLLRSWFHLNPSAQPSQRSLQPSDKQQRAQLSLRYKPGAAPILPHILTLEIINHCVNEVVFMFQKCFSVGAGCLGSTQMSRRPPWC